MDEKSPDSDEKARSLYAAGRRSLDAPPRCREEVVVGIRNGPAAAGIRTCVLALEAPTAPCPVTTTSPEVALARSTTTSVWTTGEYSNIT